MESKIIMELFYDVMHLMRKHSNVALDYHNPYIGQSKCLYQLSQTGEITQRKLADILNIRANSLSEMLSKLEQKGFVTRTQSQTDRRTYLISLTKEGEKEVKRVRMTKADSNAECLDCLTAEEKEQFYHILKKMHSHYTKDKSREAANGKE